MDETLEGENLFKTLPLSQNEIVMETNKNSDKQKDNYVSFKSPLGHERVSCEPVRVKEKSKEVVESECPVSPVAVVEARQHTKIGSSRNSSVSSFKLKERNKKFY